MGFSRSGGAAIAAAVLSCFTVFAASAAPAVSTPPSVHPSLRDPIDPTQAISQRFLSKDRQGRTVVELFVQGDVPPGLLRARGIEVNTVAGRTMTARCPLELLDALLRMPGVERVQIAERCKPVLDQSTADIGLNTVRTVTPPTFSGQTGAGILIGDVDTGIDLSHPDFQHDDGTTRLVSVWDQTITITPPAGFTYGTEWTAAQINGGASTEIDDEGHGTHVMGILGGNGRATGNGQPAYAYVGVAPEADLCMVKTNFATTNIVDGVSYIFQKAAALGERAVVNLSLGSQEGPHDGTDAFDQMIDALVGPGRIVAASAGNSQTDNIHAQTILSGTSQQTITLNVPTYTKKPGPGDDYLLVSGWYEGPDNVSLTIVTPGNITVGPVVKGGQTTVNTADGEVTIDNGTTTPANGDNEIYVEIVDQNANKAPATGIWQFTLTPVSIASTGQVDAYAYYTDLGNRTSWAQWVQGLASGGVIGTPGSADSVITAGAYVTKACWSASDGGGYCWNPVPAVGSLATFSSQGPLRDGRIKPDLAAPGFGVSSALSADATVSPQLVMTDGVHFIQAGTSMSSPHVAGTVALLLAQPAWASASPSAIKARLRETARADGFTGAVPNAAWGYGKLNAAAALAPLSSLTLLHPEKGAYVPPGKPDSVQVVIGGGVAADSVALSLSTDGGAHYSIALGTLIAVGPGAPRSLPFYVDPSMVTLAAKIRGTAYLPSAVQATAFTDSLFLIEAPVGVAEIGAAPAPRFTLEANQPNPFNPSTTIRFSLDRSGPASLRIYSVSGALVRTLVHQPLSAGAHAARWDGRDDLGRDVSSGVYLYKLSAGSKNLVRKMSLLK